MGHSVLAVPVPELEPFVRSRWQHYDPAWVSTDPAFTHAHVTVLAPFLADPSEQDIATIGAIVAATPPFEARFAEVEAFPNGIIHTPPEPAAPFAALTAAVRAAYPSLHPYDGAFEPVPHLTLDHTTADVTPVTVRAALASRLPAYVHVERLELHWYAEGGCRVLRRWSLGVEGEG